MENMEWSRTKILNLISTIRQRPALWNTKSVDYVNKDLKSMLWDELADKFGCHRYHIEKKLACLRSQHSRELLKMRKKRKQGINYESRWFAFNAMETIRTKMKPPYLPMNQTNNQDVPIEEFTAKEEPDSDVPANNDPLLLSDESNDESTYDPLNMSMVTEQKPSDRITEPSIPGSPRLDVSKTDQPIGIDQQLLLNDDLLAFGISIAAQLRNIKSSYTRSAVKLHIQKILFQAETGKL